MSRRTRLTTLALAWFLGLGALAASQASAAELSRGAALYETHCLSCHGPAEAPTNATSLNARNLGPVLREGIANARSGMLFLGSVLSPADIDDITAFLGNTPASIDFGPQARDDTGAVRSVQVRAGRENLERLTLTVQGDYARVGGSCAGRVPANTACTVDLAFRPQGLGPQAGALLIAHDGLASPARIALAGIGAPAERASFGLSADRLDFEATVVLAPAAARSLEVQNLGASPLVWAAPTLEGSQAAEFSVSGGSCSFTTPLAPGGRCVLSLGFRPAAVGARSALLRLASADGHAAATVQLTGSGQARPVGRLVLDVQRLDFGAQTLGVASLPREVQAINQGTGPLSLLSQVAPTGFSVGGDCGSRPLAVGERCRLVLRFTPAVLGPAGGELLIVTDGDGERTQLPLSGEGVRAVAQLAWLAPGERLSVGPSPVGSARRGEAVQLSNPGPDAITLLALTIDGLHAAEFAVDSTSTCSRGLQLAAGARCGVVVEALPRAVGLREARLTVQASGESPRVLTLSAEGLAAVAAAPLSSGNAGGGGCTLGQGHEAFDPVWPVLVLAALGVLALRRRQARPARPAAPPEQRASQP